jgi:hypothetical protein
MLFFFRKIRHDLIANSKFYKYLRYAIGEIVLVVIGILIALSINNWNTAQKNEIEVLNYLTNLREALNKDITSLETNLSFNKTRLKGIFYILEHSDLNTQTFTELEWVDVSKNDNTNLLWTGSFPDSLNQNFTELAFSMLGRGFGGVSFDKSVINELYSTGSFSNISSTNLKTKIADYYSFIAQRLEGYAIEEHEEWANETTRFLRDRYGIFTLDVSGLEDSITILKSKNDVEHQLRYLALEVNYHCIWVLEAKKKALYVVSLIDSQIQPE